MSTANELKGFFDAMLSGIEDKNLASGETIAALPRVVEAVDHLREGDISRFHIRLMYPIDNTIDGVLAKEFQSREARFLAKNYTFVEENFKSLIVKYEGSACSTDKSRTILRALFHFFVAGKKIVFDQSQQYTYHLPRYLFTSHEEILEFFDGLYRLYYGKSENFMRASVNAHKAGLAAQAKRMSEIKPDDNSSLSGDAKEGGK
jgi:hypothetical protein